jgi:DNA-binding winged helix-turn-helix (wHTH) protein/TolB-like protein/Flp pilus assembly protein TadD
MSNQPPKIYEFGPYRLDVKERILQRDGEQLPLTPKVFDLLALLVENHGHLMEKDILLKALWPDSFVEEANLNVNVSALRRALGESPTDSRFIETVPRRGYRFVAQVMELPVVSPAAIDSSAKTEVPTPAENIPLADEINVTSLTPTPAADRGRSFAQSFSQRWVLWLMLLFLVVGSASLLAWRYSRAARSMPGKSVHSLAVLPFQPLTADSADEALEMGMADALITRLSNSKDLVVRPTSSVMKYVGAGTNALAAGRELEVDAVLVGRVQRADNRIRVTVQLLRVSDEVPIWAERFDDYFTNIFAVQDSISEKMAEALAMRLSGNDKEQLTRRSTESTEAYQLYMQGRYFHFKYDFAKALGFFQAAVEKDPEYSLPYTGLALNYVALSTTTPDGSEFRAKALNAAEKAVSLDPRLDEAHNALGWVKYLGEWDWVGAEQEFRRAIELNPNNSQAHINYASVLSILGRHAEALQEGQQALKLDPRSGDVYFNHILHLYDARRYDEALELSKKGIEVDPDQPGWNSLLPRIYSAKAEYDLAIKEVQKRGQQNSAKQTANLGYALARSGKRSEAQVLLDDALKRVGRSGANGVIVMIYLGLDDQESAMDWLEKAYQARENIMIHLKVEPLFDSVRSNPRFVELQRRMKLQ